MNYTSKFLAFLIYCSFTTIIFSQEAVPNGNLDEWTGNTPNDWNTSNSLTGLPFIGYQSVIKSNDAHEGNYAAKIITGNLLGNIVPGFLTIGVLNVNIENPEQSGITGGHPFTSRPLLLRGHYKYSTPGEDTGLGAVLLSKYNVQTGERDTIAAGGWFFIPENEYVEFSMPILYLLNETPDTLNILFLSSNIQNSTQGSELFVDGLEFVYGQVSFIDLGEDTFLCSGQTLTLDAGDGFESYVWVSIDGLEPVGEGQYFVVTQPGHYGVVALDSEGLPVTGTIKITGIPGPEVFDVEGGGIFSHPETGAEITLNGSQEGTRYLLYRNESLVDEWQGTGLPISFGLQPAGQYSVKAINVDEYECEMMMSGVVIVTNTTIVHEIFSDDALLIFPNPGKDVFSVKTSAKLRGGRLSVFALGGEKILEETIQNHSEGAFTFLMPKEIEPGVYLMRLELKDNRVLSGKFIISR